MTYEEWWSKNSCNLPWRYRGPVVLTKEAWEAGAQEVKDKLEEVLRNTPFIEIKCPIDGDTVRSIIYHAVQHIRCEMKENKDG